MSLVKYLIVFVFILSACSREKKPDVIPVPEMSKIMWDMVRADQYVADFVIKDTALSKKQESIKLYEAIFRIHHITQAEFKKSMDYYKSKPELIQPLLDSLVKMQREAFQPKPFKKDSINKSFPGNLPQ
jgi:hypothetical protein